MHDAVLTFRTINIVAYTALGVVALVYLARRRDAASMWAAATFGSLGLLELLSLVPNASGNVAERALVRVDIALLVLFPYLLFRFTTAFRKPGQRFANALFSLTALLIVWTFALPKIPQPGEPRPGVFVAYIVVFMIHWAVLSIVSARRLWRAGSSQPTVARRRMHLLALASAGLIVALLLAVPARPELGPRRRIRRARFAQRVAFLLGFAPPHDRPALVADARRQRGSRQRSRACSPSPSRRKRSRRACSSPPRPSSARARSRSATRREGSSPPGTSRPTPGRASSSAGTLRRSGPTPSSSTSRFPAAASSSGRRRTRRSSATRSSPSSGRSGRSPASRSTASASSRPSTSRAWRSSARTR